MVEKGEFKHPPAWAELKDNEWKSKSLDPNSPFLKESEPEQKK